MIDAEVIPLRYTDDDVVSVSELARLLGVSAKTVLAWSRSGRLPSVIELGPKTNRFNVGAVRQALRSAQQRDVNPLGK